MLTRHVISAEHCGAVIFQIKVVEIDIKVVEKDIIFTLWKLIKVRLASAKWKSDLMFQLSIGEHLKLGWQSHCCVR